MLSLINNLSLCHKLKVCIKESIPFLIIFNQGGLIKVIFTGICVGITMRQGYNTASKYIGGPMSTQVQELPMKGR